MKSRNKKKKTTAVENITRPMVHEFWGIPHDPLFKDRRVTGERETRIFPTQMVKPLVVL